MSESCKQKSNYVRIRSFESNDKIDELRLSCIKNPLPAPPNRIAFFCAPSPTGPGTEDRHLAVATMNFEDIIRMGQDMVGDNYSI